MVAGGADAVLIETSQDLLQTKAAIVGARRALRATGSEIPVFAQVTVETTGTMLLGTEIGAALGYLCFRFPHVGWQETHPNLTKLYAKLMLRPSFTDTAPHD